MRFKVGDRVRIDCRASPLHGREGTVWKVHRAPHRKWGDPMKDQGVRWWHTAYLVDVDGFGRHWVNRIGFLRIFDSLVGFPHFHLKPALRDPAATEYVERLKLIASARVPS